MAEYPGYSQQISESKIEKVEFIEPAEVTEVPDNPVRQLINHRIQCVDTK